MPLTRDQIKLAIKASLTQIWIYKDLSVIDALYHPNAQVEGYVPSYGMMDRDGFKDMVAHFQIETEVRRIDVEDLVYDGAKRSVFQITADIYCKTHEKLGRMRMFSKCKFEAGLIVEDYTIFDFLPYFEDVGALPQDSAMICIAGASLR